MTDLSGLLQSAEGDGVHWALETSGDLNVNLVHLDPGHSISEHANDDVDVVIVVLAGSGRLTIDGRGAELAAHVVANVPRLSRRSVRAAEDQALDYLSIHRRRGQLGIRSSLA
jgi:quercetin dioxygenase-like cupin family protein